MQFLEFLEIIEFYTYIVTYLFIYYTHRRYYYF